MTTIQNIELRQADASSVQFNGDYDVNLSKAITISDGDVVQFSKGFIDTVRESDINIVEDLTLVFKTGVYLTSWYRWSSLIQAAVLKDGQPYTDTPDFLHYIPYEAVDTGEAEGFSLYNNVQFDQYRTSGEDLPPVGLTYRYVSYAGQLSYITVYTPIIRTGDYKILFVNLNIIAVNDTVDLIATTYDLAKAGLIFERYNASDVDNIVYQPFLFETQINLPKGVYSPIQISTYISEQLSQSNLSVDVENQNMNNSKFLFSTTDFDIGKAYPDGRKNPDGTPKLLAEQTKFISDDGEVMLTFIPDEPTAEPPTVGPNFLLGSSQLGLEFNQDSNKFQFTQLHSNMYDATSGQNVSVRYLRYNFDQNGKVMGIANNGGIYINSLTAFNKSGKFVPFWTETMGFDLSSLSVQTTYAGIGLFNVADSNFYLSNKLVSGVNITDGYYGLDSSIIRGTSGSPETANKWIFRQPVPFYEGTGPDDEAQAGICSTIQNTVAIIAAQPIDVLLNKFSHYILQTDLGFSNNDYIGVEWYKNINAVISKYYAYGSYCAAESESAIQYVHKGSDIQLKSIRVRLLTSNKKIDTNLGPDNTIIFQVLKAANQLPPIKKEFK
jgi:hypothetical protein